MKSQMDERRNREDRERGWKKEHTIWVVYANESDPPADATPVSWMLLTTLPIGSFEDALEKLKWYTVRWQIEIYHKIIKSGCRIEDRQLSVLPQLKYPLIVVEG